MVIQSALQLYDVGSCKMILDALEIVPPSGIKVQWQCMQAHSLERLSFQSLLYAHSIRQKTNVADNLIYVFHAMGPPHNKGVQAFMK